MPPPLDRKLVIADRLLLAFTMFGVLLFGLTAFETTSAHDRRICLWTIVNVLGAYGVYRLSLVLLDRWYDRAIARLKDREDAP